jgi:hypothetical protein
MFQSTHCGVSSLDIQNARKKAKRIRVSVACARCKSGKIKCSDFRPCRSCVRCGIASECSDSSIQDGPRIFPRKIGRMEPTESVRKEFLTYDDRDQILSGIQRQTHGCSKTQSADPYVCRAQIQKGISDHSSKVILILVES